MYWFYYLVCKTWQILKETFLYWLLAWVQPRIVFDEPALLARKKDLEQVASQPEFWNDPKNAQKRMRQLDEVKAELEKLITWRGAIEDANLSLELYELDPDEEMLAEI